MVIIGDGLTRGHLITMAFMYVMEHKRRDEPVGIGVEPARPDGWTITVEIGGSDVGVSARVGPASSVAYMEAVLAGLLEQARRQAAYGAEVIARSQGAADPAPDAHSKVLESWQRRAAQ